MYVADFDFELPRELIAQKPPAQRGASRLLMLERQSGALQDRHFHELPHLLRPGDLLVVNDTRVFAARLLGRRLPGGGSAECLLLRRVDPEGDDPGSSEIWESLVHPGQRLRVGSRLEFGVEPNRIEAEILDRRFHGRRLVRLWSASADLTTMVDALGHVPLPPYIKRAGSDTDRERYQTVFARARGSVAAPTAGLHFTPAILSALAARGVDHTSVTLHVGYGTFQPMRADKVADHQMEAEHFEVTSETANAINRARREGRRVIAVGTTTTRTLESLPIHADSQIVATTGSTELFIRPGHRFRVVTGLITNFHLPRSSLLVLVSAFAGRDQVLAAYRHAIRERYRFYSYGDAMLIV
jgi:S-adenosylmethionine:tRNA ribosyltransferase-isomerase